MIRLYPYSTLKAALIAIPFGLLSSLASSAQTSPCGPIVENFNNTGGTMAGFSSVTQASADPGFTYSTTGQDGFLSRCNVPGNTAVYEIVSPTYNSIASQTAIGVGFELTGQVQVSEINIFIEYLNSNTGTVSTAWVSTTTPVYSGNAAAVCQVIPYTSIPGFTPGSVYRLHIYLRPASSSNNNQCIEFDDFRTTGAAVQSTLPVVFTNFFGRASGNSVLLTWNVAGEVDVNRYEVEKSTDGSHFTKLGEVEASDKTSYSFTDANAGAAVVFYRVRNVDIDGQYKYTGIVRMNLSRSIKLSAYPLPFSNQLTIEHGLATAGRITVSTAAGQVIQTIAVKADMTQTTIPTTTLKSGLYIVRYQNEKGESQSLKAIKQ